MKKIDMDLLNKLFQQKASGAIVLDALCELAPKKKNYKNSIIIVVVCLIPSFLMGISYDTYSLFLGSIDIINNSITAVFGIIFTGYALFQAFINDELLIRLLNEPDREKKDKRSKLQETNENFVGLMMLCIISIILNVFLKITISSVPEEFVVFDKRIYNNIVVIILMEIYFVFNAKIFWELKSFVFNIFQLFNLHAASKIIDIINDDK